MTVLINFYEAQALSGMTTVILIESPFGRDIICNVDHSPFFPSNRVDLVLNWCPNGRLNYVHDPGTTHSLFLLLQI